MTNASIAQAEPVLVAIDIAKARHEVLISVPGRKRRRRLTVLNQLDDFNRWCPAEPCTKSNLQRRHTHTIEGHKGHILPCQSLRQGSCMRDAKSI